MSNAIDQLPVTHNTAENRFETILDGRRAEIDYRMVDPKLISLNHTEVPQEWSGRGVASKLTRFALDYAREQGMQVMPYCPFIHSYIRKHGEYRDLVHPKFKF